MKNHQQVITNCFKYLMNTITEHVMYYPNEPLPKYVKEAYDKINNDALNGLDVTKLTKNELRVFGCAAWDTEGPMLLPLYLGDNVVPFESVDINMEKEWFDPELNKDRDARFGNLAFGVIPADMARFTKFTVATSSEKKQDEFREIIGAEDVSFLDIDIDEVDGTPDEVIVYKVREVPENTLVEDSIVVIDGKPIVDWKFSYHKHVVPGKAFTWEVRVAVREGGVIRVVKESCDLVFTNEKPQTSDFDPYSQLPNEPWLTVQDMKRNDGAYESKWSKSGHDPRYKAIQKLKSERFDYSIPENIIQPWNGLLQK